MANQNMQYIQNPKVDWTEDAGLHQRFKDWTEEVEFLMDTGALSHQKCRYKNEICDPLGRKGRQDIFKHTGARQPGQSKHYIGQS